MKHKTSRFFPLLLVIALLMTFFASTALAEDILDGGDKVLTEIALEAAVSPVNVSGKTSATLTVPFEAAQTIDLSVGLNLAYNRSAYTSATPRFPDGSQATVDGDPVTMQVVYQKKDDDAFYQTEYSVSLVRAQKTGAEFSGTIDKDIDPPATVKLTERDFTDCYTKNDGAALDYVIIEGAKPSFGTLKLSGKEYKAGSKVTLANIKKGYLTFAATAGGEVSYLVTAYGADDSKAAGSVVLKISSQSSKVKDITLETPYETPIKFSASKFNEICKDVTGETLSYVTFSLPGTSYGKLYYKYTSASKYDSTVSSTKKYYYTGDTPELGQVSFVPKSSTSGKVTISYKGYSSSGESYDGKIVITVDKTNDYTVSYKTNDRTPYEFSSSEFNKVCEKICNGATLSYVTFTQPSSSAGRLYYNYGKSSQETVSSKTKYYRSGTPSIGNVSFVPTVGYGGTVTIRYSARSTQADTYTGEIKMTVSKTKEKSLEYEISSGTALTFDASDFNSLCKDTLGSTLSYVKFTLPASTYGKLYYDYNTATGKYEATVSSSSKYYRSGSPSLSKVTFVPKDTYSGSFNLSFTMYDSSNESYKGTLKIRVSDTVTYRSEDGDPVHFKPSDFNTVCKNTTGSTLSYVKFTQPASNAGKLYYDYTSINKYDSLISPSTKYNYRSTDPELAKVTFVPKDGYDGTVIIKYTGCDIRGNTYEGQVKITVDDGDRETSRHFKDVGKNHKWAIKAIDHLYEDNIVKGVDGENFRPQADITRGDFILMLHRAFGFKTSRPSKYFSDVPKNSYYYDAIATAKALGIAQGYDNKFGPNDVLLREDAMVLALRALEAKGGNLRQGNSTDLAGYTDRNQVASYAVDAIATLIRADLIQGSGNRIEPKSHMTRAEMAVFLDRLYAVGIPVK